MKQYFSLFRNCVKTAFTISILLLSILDTSCKKYLDAKPDQKLAIPSSLKDMELLLDNYDIFNSRSISIGEVAADNYYLKDSAAWLGVTFEPHRYFYIWQAYDNVISDWSASYNTILYCNVILETLPDIPYGPGELGRWNNIKGCALYFRSTNFYELAQLFCQPYDKNTSNTDLGIPLRLNSNTNQVSVRSTVQQTYDRILEDLKEAVTLLPDTGAVKYRPSKAAAYGLLARTYLMMQDYPMAGLYADSCLRLYNKLMDYNLPPVSKNAIPQWNTEVIFDSKTQAPSALAQTRERVDSNLFRSYLSNDLRRAVFFKMNSDGSFFFKGNYTGANYTGGSNASLFTGIATDEMYFTRSESYARTGNIAAALIDLNTVMKKRWNSTSPSQWVDFSTTNADTALTLILTERRKELLFRGLRWSDLRRLNKEPHFAITLRRKLNSQIFELMPNSLRYVFLIDGTAIQYSGMPQNP